MRIKVESRPKISAFLCFNHFIYAYAYSVEWFFYGILRITCVLCMRRVSKTFAQILFYHVYDGCKRGKLFGFVIHDSTWPLVL